MATVTIRNLDDATRDRLRVRAAQHGRSMEAEARAILTEAVNSPVERTLYDILMELREAAQGVDIEPFLPSRDEFGRDPFA